MQKLLTFAILVGITSLGLALGQSRGEKYAFLVACSKYNSTQLRDLPYTIEEMADFRKALIKTGFDADNIVLLHDQAQRERIPEKAKIEKQFRLLLNGLQPNDTIVVAINGHGVHFKGDKVGYYCPLGADLKDKKSLVAMDFFYDLLKKSKARQKLMIVQACQDDPFISNVLAAERLEFTEKSDEVPEGIAAIFSCTEGQQSYYDPSRKRGLFFDHVIRAWNGEYLPNRDAGLDLEEFFRQVRVKTKADALKFRGGVAQVPEVRRDYKGEWVIVPAPKQAATPPSQEKRTFKFTALDQVGNSFFEDLDTTTTRTIKIDEKEEKETQRLRFLIKWTPQKRDRDGNWVLSQKYVGVKMDFDRDGNKTNYSSLEKGPKNPIADFFAALMKHELTYTIRPDFRVMQVTGASALAKELASVDGANGKLLPRLLSEEALQATGQAMWFPIQPGPLGAKEAWRRTQYMVFAHPMWFAFPTRASVVPRETWEKKFSLHFGALGSFDSEAKFVYQGGRADQDRIEMDLTYNYSHVATPEYESDPLYKSDLPHIALLRSYGRAGGGEAFFDHVKGRFSSYQWQIRNTGAFKVDVNGSVITPKFVQTQEIKSVTLDDLLSWVK